jgi:DNA-binding MarR family transcriptional regulator
MGSHTFRARPPGARSRDRAAGNGGAPHEPSAAAAREIQTILDGIRFLVHRLRESSRQTERRMGLSGAQLFVLQHLQDSDDLSVNDLAARTYTHQSSVSVVVSRLVRRGLVRRRRSPRDARRRSLSLSEQGRRVLRSAPEAPQGAIIGALERLPGAHRRAVAAAMRRVAADMGAASEQAMFFEMQTGKR